MYRTIQSKVINKFKSKAKIIIWLIISFIIHLQCKQSFCLSLFDELSSNWLIPGSVFESLYGTVGEEGVHCASNKWTDDVELIGKCPLGAIYVSRFVIASLALMVDESQIDMLMLFLLTCCASIKQPILLVLFTGRVFVLNNGGFDFFAIDCGRSDALLSKHILLICL